MKEGVRCRCAPCVLRSLGHRLSGLHPSLPIPRPTPDGYSAALHSRACRPDDPLRRSSLRRISGNYALRRHPCRDHRPYDPISPGFPDTTQTSRGKTGRLRCTTTESIALALHGRELRGHMPARPAGQASYPVPVHRIAALLHAYFGRYLAAAPTRFTDPSPPSGWMEDFRLQAVSHAPYQESKKYPDRNPGVGQWLDGMRRDHQAVGLVHMPSAGYIPERL